MFVTHWKMLGKRMTTYQFFIFHTLFFQESFNLINKMHNFIKKKIVHILHIKDYWVECKDDREVRRWQYHWLQMHTMGLFDAPPQVDKDDKVLQSNYIYGNIEEMSIVEPNRAYQQIVLVELINEPSLEPLYCGWKSINSSRKNKESRPLHQRKEKQVRLIIINMMIYLLKRET